ncbi:type II secretion system protein [Candidatus Saccharibacteria bacterium]|nr:type II secretion system protein [Candidatus Saccharibacteria bacterium]
MLMDFGLIISILRPLTPSQALIISLIRLAIRKAVSPPWRCYTRFLLDTNFGGGTLKSMNRKAHGFTIVELLIVIVVIAILAAISIAAYTNIQQRAKNTAIINAASQSLKMIQAYIAEYGTYPYSVPSGSGKACITSIIGCAEGAYTVEVNGTFDTNMAMVGVLPRTTSRLEGDTRYGLIYAYETTRKINGQSQPATLMYYIQGANQQCGMSVITEDGNPISSTGYTTSTAGKTFCRVSIPGPTHS